MNEPMILISSIYLAISVVNFVIISVIAFIIYHNLKIHYETQQRTINGKDVWVYISAFIIVAMLGFLPIINMLLLVRFVNEMKNLNPLINFFLELADYNIYDPDWDTK